MLTVVKDVNLQFFFSSDQTFVIISSCKPLEKVKDLGINIFQLQKMLRLL